METVEYRRSLHFWINVGFLSVPLCLVLILCQAGCLSFYDATRTQGKDRRHAAHGKYRLLDLMFPALRAVCSHLALVSVIRS